MIRNLLIFITLSFACQGVLGANTWAISNVKIVEVLIYNDHGYNVITVVFTPQSPLDTGCLPTDTHNMASTYTQNNINSTSQTWISLLLAAQAQQFDVDLLVNLSNCSTQAVWDEFGSPTGLGASFHGVRAARDN